MAVPVQRRKNEASNLTDADLRHHQQELGKVGEIFGSRDNAPIYFAGILAISALIGAIAVGVISPPFPEKGDLVKLLGSITLAALSFIGGASGKSR